MADQPDRTKRHTPLRPDGSPLEAAYFIQKQVGDVIVNPASSIHLDQLKVAIDGIISHLTPTPGRGVTRA